MTVCTPKRTIDAQARMSKSKKKNQKRADKKHQSEGFEVEETIVGAGPSRVTKQDPVQELREQLAQAKADKNHELANKLRQQLWITQDLVAGYKPHLSSEDKASQEALSKVVEAITPSAPAKLTGAAASSTSSLGSDERKLKTLTKKLDQIQKLKKKQEQGLTLEANQLAKIQTEEDVLEEIEHVQELLSVPVKR